MTSLRSLVLMLALSAACGRSGEVRGEPPADAVVGRWGALEVRASDVRHARTAGRADPTDAAIEILVDEILAGRAAAELPEAPARAEAAARRVGIDQLLDAEMVIGDEEIESYHRRHAGEMTRPAEVALAHIVLADCAAARRVAAELAAGGIDFSVAALHQSIDQQTRVAGGDLGWRTVAELSDTELAALQELDRPGAISKPVPDGDTCRLLKLVDRRAASTPEIGEVRAWVRMRLRAERRGQQRALMLQRLGGAERAGSRATDDDQLLWDEARARGLDQSAAVRAARRAALVTALRDALWAPITPASIAAAEVRRVYQLDLGDYTTPRRVRIAALVTRDPAKAERWARLLRAAPAPADALRRLLPESEDAAARARTGDMGWIDGRSTHYPESFKAAALALSRPGAVAGAVQAAGAHHVLLCVDLVGERVAPLAEVEPGIRATLAERRRREVYEQVRRGARELVRSGVDPAALAGLDTDEA